MSRPPISNSSGLPEFGFTVVWKVSPVAGANSSCSGGAGGTVTSVADVELSCEQPSVFHCEYIDSSLRFFFLESNPALLLVSLWRITTQKELCFAVGLPMSSVMKSSEAGLVSSPAGALLHEVSVQWKTSSARLDGYTFWQRKPVQLHVHVRFGLMCSAAEWSENQCARCVKFRQNACRPTCPPWPQTM